MKKKNIIDEISLKMMLVENEKFIYSDCEIIDLIKQLTSINMIGRDGRTLLMHAVAYNRIFVAKYLTERQADIDAQDDLGYTALHIAVTMHNEELVDYFLSHSAQVNAIDKFGNTPLLRASHNDLHIIEKLIGYGADPLHVNHYGVNPMDAFSAYPDILTILKTGKGR